MIDNSRGFTIIELLTVMGVAAVLLSAISLVTGRTFTISREQVVQVRTTDDVRIQSQRILDAIKNAPLIDCDNDGYTEKPEEYWLQAAAGNDITLLSNIDDDSDLERLRYYVDPANSNELRRAVTNPTGTCSYPTTPDTDQVILQSLNNGANQLFHFYPGSDDSTEITTINSTTIVTVKRIGFDFAVARSQGRASASTTIKSSAAARAVRCVPGECEPLPKQPGPSLVFTVEQTDEPTNSGTSIIVPIGRDITLRWSATDCGSGPVASDAWSGTKALVDTDTVLPVSSPAVSRYVLFCDDGQGHTLEQSVTVSVDSDYPVVVLRIRSSSASAPGASTATIVTASEQARLDWEVTNCDQLPQATANDSPPTWSGGKRATDTVTLGPFTTPRTIRYTLSCTRTDGRSHSVSVTLNVQDRACRIDNSLSLHSEAPAGPAGLRPLELTTRGGSIGAAWTVVVPGNQVASIYTATAASLNGPIQYSSFVMGGSDRVFHDVAFDINQQLVAFYRATIGARSGVFVRNPSEGAGSDVLVGDNANGSAWSASRSGLDWSAVMDGTSGNAQLTVRQGVAASSFSLVNIGPPPKTRLDPDIAYSPDGRQGVVVWAEDRRPDNNVQNPYIPGISGKRVAATGGVGGVIDVITEAPTATSDWYASDPDVSVDDSGNFVVAWVWQEGTYNPATGCCYVPARIYVRRFNAAGNPVTNGIEVANNVAAPAEVGVHLHTNGEYTVIWQSKNSIYAQQFTASDQVIGPANLIVSNNATIEDIDVEPLNDTTTVVGWRYKEGGAPGQAVIAAGVSCGVPDPSTRVCTETNVFSCWLLESADTVLDIISGINGIVNSSYISFSPEVPPTLIGKSTGSLFFDNLIFNENSSDKGVIIPYNVSSYDFTQSFTVMAWFKKVNGVNTNWFGTLLSFNNPTSTANRTDGTVLDISINGDLRSHVGNPSTRHITVSNGNSSSGSSPITPGSAWVPDSWHHVAVVATPATGPAHNMEITIYVDGNLLTNKAAIGAFCVECGGEIRIGSERDVGRLQTPFQDGYIDDVRWYAAELDQTAIKAAANLP